MTTKTIISPVDTVDRAALDIRPGDTIKVWQKIEEKGKTRLQAFEGIVLARKHGKEAGATFTVRRTAGGFGVERIFPLYSPAIEKIEITKRVKVRRAKLYHIRDKAAREIKRQMRNIRFVDIKTGVQKEVPEEVEKVPEPSENVSPTEEVMTKEVAQVEETKSEEALKVEETNVAVTETKE